MRLRLCLISILFTAPIAQSQQIAFTDYFVDKTMRVDYWHVGSKLEESIVLDKIYAQGTWAGNPSELIYPFPYGRYRVELFDDVSNRLLFSKGYDGYFAEYKTTDPAAKGVQRVFSQSALVPFPKRPVMFVIERRDTNNVYHPQFKQRIDPEDYHIDTGISERGDQVYHIVQNGNPHDKVDIVFISEGYTVSEKKKFESDLEKYCNIFFNWEPYKSRKSQFNISGIFGPSAQSGVDEPRQGKYQNTLLDATFNSMDSDRYLLTENNKMMRDVASQVPYDFIVIIVNSRRYGGGALFGCYSTFTSDGPWSEYVFLHEFGHNFGGLGDEYYSSDVAYNEFYTPGVEPTEPNLTELLDPDSLKWKALVTPGIPIPTPWGQEQFDSLNVELRDLGKQQLHRINALKDSGASESEIVQVREEYTRRTQALQNQLREFMMNNPMRGKIGAFRGAGYSSKGLYRPTINSLMNQFNEHDRSYYPVNEQAIVKMIDFYSGN